MIKHFNHIEEVTVREKIFEALMIRFEILNMYRIPVVKIYKHLLKKPDLVLIFIPHIIKSLNIIIEYISESSDGLVGKLKSESILIVYILTFLTWKNDETKGLDKTMSALDNYLNKIEILMNLFKIEKK